MMQQQSIQSYNFREKNKTMVRPPKENKALFFKIPSNTEPSKQYDIRVMPDGEVKCSCKANVLGGMQCRHIKFFLKRYNVEHEKLANEIDSSELVKEDFAVPSEAIEIVPNIEI